MENLKKLLCENGIIVFAPAMDYVMEKGKDHVRNISDETIENMHGGEFFGDEYVRAIARCAREIARLNPSFHKLVEFCATNVWIHKGKEDRYGEIATTALSYLQDNDLLQDYFEDRCIDLTEEEKEWFGIYDEDDEE